MKWPDVSPDAELVDRIRQRPEMYIGGRGPAGLFWILRDAVDEIVELYLGGVVTRVELSLHGEYGVQIAIHLAPQERSHWQRWLEKLLSSVRAHPEALKLDRPRAAINRMAGLPMMNILGESLAIYAEDNSGGPCQRFARGFPTGSVNERVMTGPLTTREDGGFRLYLRWLPDREVMGSIDPPVSDLLSRFRTLACLAPGLELKLTSSLDEDSVLDEECHSPHGMRDYLLPISTGFEYQHDAIRATGKEEGIDVDLALVHTRGECSMEVGFVNHHRTDRGEHLKSLREGLAAALIDYTFTRPFRAGVPTAASVGEGLF